MELGSTVRERMSEYLETAADILAYDETGGLYEVDPDELDGDALRELKDERLQHTVEYAWENSEFYRERMEEEGIEPEDVEGIEDIEELPIVDADEVRENQPPRDEAYRFAADDGTDVRRPFSTSGSTGEPKVFFKSYDEMERIYDDLRRGFEYFGLSEDSVFVNYLPFVGLNPSNFYSEGGMEEIGLETVPISNTDYPPEYEHMFIEEYVDGDEDMVVMNGLASHIDAKGRAFEEAGFDPADLDVDLITLSGEPVTESRKQSIGEMYDAEVREFLGSTENGGFAYEDLDADGLRVLDDSVHIEVVDEDGEPVPDGEEGDLIVTNLLHPGEESAMPLIRYNIGDRTRVLDREDGDGTGSMRIEAPHRQGWEFVFGAVNLDIEYFEDTIYDLDELDGAVGEYQLRLDYDEDSGREGLEVLVESTDESIAGDMIEDAEYIEDPDSVAENLTRELLDGHSHFRDTVDNVDAARLDVQILEDGAIDFGKGKPDRLVDERGE